MRRFGRVGWFQLVSLAVVLSILLSAAIRRFANTDHLLWASDEMVTLMAGIRLHLLPLWNFATDDARENFFKSLVMPIHGLGDNVFFYLVVWGLRLLRLPVTEHYLFSAGAALSVISLVLLFLLVQRLFGLGAGVFALALASWNQVLIDFSVKGFQINFVVFLQLAAFCTYLLHVSRDRWSWSLLMTILMVLVAGSELFYLAPMLLLFHAAVRWSFRLGTVEQGRYVRFMHRKNLVVWGGYGVMFLVNVALFFIVGHRIPLTLFGQLAVKHRLGASWTPDYGLDDFIFHFDAVMPEIPHAAVVALVAVGWLLLRNRRAPYALFFSGYVLFITVLAYAMKFVLQPNLMHLILPVVVVISVAVTGLITWAMERWWGRVASLGPLSGICCAAAFLPLAAPWRVMPLDQPGEPYRCVKAVGYALRELGQPHMDIRVMFLSDHAYIPTTMEFYTGLCASWDDHEPTRLFYLRAPRPDYLPSRIAERVGLDRFDHYVDFTKERFPMKPEVLADVRPLKLHEVYRIMDGDSVCATISSPRPWPSRVLSVEEGNAAFNRTYAYWPRLFSSVNVGAFWYYDANY